VSRLVSGARQQLGSDLPAYQSEQGSRVFSDADGIHIALIGPGPGGRTRTGGLLRYRGTGWTQFCGPMVDPALPTAPPIDALSYAGGAADPANDGYVIGAITNFGTRRMLVQRLLKP
jgi:hypothetical protein